MNRRLFAAAGVIALLGLSACGGSDTDDTASGGTTAPTMSATAPSASPSMMSAQFGPGCAAVPTDPANPGSFDAMAKVPVATAASGNPVLSTLVTAVKKANLVDSLNGAQGVTVFAPTNDAFAKIPKADLDKVLADDATLEKVLTYHVVPTQLSPDTLAGTHKTLQGGDVTVTGSDMSFTVDGTSMVVCGNVSTANATVYIVDAVLMPKS
ncbi:fasciclin domain-containing protein [Micromonospora endolithica]|uniref:Fasciclin domain-containing protein n=1 Tax=Micromonospora endolithica TaxID=230091 RepID=A0A3A9YRH8_9ACTN|nr:fasciclin domain-containing protein [Micromonospora endolithica]RKN38628.1 fasciclin domain-containing protein [Micromonospora endolithica]TWJ25236.1 putative surface protein with fasciclin (FAS1) repeats [Micromonospora endolithica]